VTTAGGPLRFVRLALKNVIQNDGDFVEVILLYTVFFKCIPGYTISGDTWSRLRDPMSGKGPDKSGNF
jgi:hypothetical protein